MRRCGMWVVREQRKETRIKEWGGGCMVGKKERGKEGKGKN